MNERKIYITEQDHTRLSNLVGRGEGGSNGDKQYLKALREELDRATIVPADRIPADVITMNSKVILRDLDSREKITCTLVFPGQANIDKGCISVLAPIGTALIGYRVGDTIEWSVPAGKTRFKVEEILYQPEAAAHSPA
ncbi:MAG: nucleoside diphosphate kinase regulator [Bacteroidetes bacterium]|nr:nucleoside diphosphate kinase regulator [Bacteroidota bacterium]